MPQSLLRKLVGRYAFTADSCLHRLPFVERIPPLRNLQETVCLAADITVGWGPAAADWETAKTPALIRFYRWFWQGLCPDCGGNGTLEQVHPVEMTVECFGCEGAGRDRCQL